MEHLIAPTLNLLILVSVLVYYLRAPLRAFIYQRHTLLKDELEEVRNQLKQARAKFDDFSNKLKGVANEVELLRQQSRQDAETTKTRLIGEATRLSTTIREDARTSAAGLYVELRRQLSSELGARVIDRAEAILRERLTGDDQARIRQEFSNQVETVQ